MEQRVAMLKTLIVFAFLKLFSCHEIVEFIQHHQEKYINCVPSFERTVDVDYHCFYHCLHTSNCIAFNMLYYTDPITCHFFTPQSFCLDAQINMNSKFFFKRFRDCLDIYNAGMRRDGVYIIATDNNKAFEVYCDMSDGGGWTVFQRHFRANNYDFNKTWIQYKNGFGNLHKDFWLGNDNIHFLTNNKTTEFKATFKRKNKHLVLNLQYKSFSVESEAHQYRLTIANNIKNGPTDSMSNHNGMVFSTMDNENANNCSQASGNGGWWYNSCHHINPNGDYNEDSYITSVSQAQKLLDEISLKMRRTT